MMMQRDGRVLGLVERRQQVTAGHVSALLFAENRSLTPVYRTLARMEKNQLITRIGYRAPDMVRGGASAVVYALGRRGWAVVGRKGSYYRPKVSEHDLAVTDCIVQLRELEAVGKLAVDGFEDEPDCHRTISGYYLKPDLYVVVRYSTGVVRHLWLEVDMATERTARIKEKLARYYNAYSAANELDLPVFPLVVFIAPDDARSAELNWIIGGIQEQRRDFFRATSFGGFADLLDGLNAI